MDSREIIKSLIKHFSLSSLRNFFRRIAPTFRPEEAELNEFFKNNWPFDNAQQLGIIDLPDSQSVLIAAVHVEQELTTRSSKKIQYELGKRILKASNHNAGIFAFYDDAGRFRFSLITVFYSGIRRQFSSFRRYTFFVDPTLPNKTFINQIGRADFSSLNGILEAFSLEAVSDAFYQEFKPKYDAIAEAVLDTTEEQLKKDFALLFVIRIIFLGFVQKKGWLGDNPRFLQDFWKEYQNSKCPQNTFYREWLAPLFFEALNNPPDSKVAYGRVPFSKDTQKALQTAPYLNGELFKPKTGVDDRGLWIPDDLIGDFFDFLFQYNFTVEENELYDEELELNPEFLGIIFERITNMDQGAVYTPRVEVDFMCRLALVQWLMQTTNIDPRELYYFFFREAGRGEEYDEHQRQGDFSPDEIRTLIEKLESVTVCDPAAGSGAFEVGMLQVLDQALENLYARSNTPADLKAKAPSPFERKKAIIERSLYGVEVKRWAVWINHLRLWLTLFVDMPDDFKTSVTPLLPNLTFKVRSGDSLVQRIGNKTFPVHEHANLPSRVRDKITELKKKKRDFFYNQNLDEQLIKHIKHLEGEVFRSVLDAQIDQKKKQLKNLPYGDVPLSQQLEQQRRECARAIENQRLTLEAEIKELNEQKRSLKEEDHFLWSIEFAEIFFDRGGFDIIIGNPPYVRQEEISDPMGCLTPEEYKKALLEMVRFDFPDYFAKSRARIDQFKKGRKPSGRSDLYTYFYVRSLRLLNREGVHVFICSNSWLDVGYGAWLQEFFLRNAPLHLVIDNHAKRSFARADVNTIITVASAPRRVLPNHRMLFVAFKRPFEDAVLTENLLDITNATEILKTDTFRVFPITAGELLREGSDDGKYVGDKWGGKYLRAPDIFFTILEKGRGKLVRLGDIAEVRFGIKTGANDFFYLEPVGPGSRPGLLRMRNGVGWEGEIEEEFLKPVIKSPRECRTIVINPDNLRYRIFMCHKSKEELKGTKALEYIEWGEKQGYHRRPTCRSRRHWWDVGTQPQPTALWFKAFNDTFLVPVVTVDVKSSDRFYAIYTKVNGNWMVALNNTLVALMTELNGRLNLGQGALDNMTYEATRNLILKPLLLPKFPLSRNGFILPIFTECGIDPESDVPIAEQEPNPLPDRKALDDVVFDALGLTEEERKEVYRAVCQLVWERISKARSV